MADAKLAKCLVLCRRQRISWRSIASFSCHFFPFLCIDCLKNYKNTLIVLTINVERMTKCSD
jgi:hypothetical protein